MIARIDLKLAIFDYKRVYPGTAFDVKKFNSDLYSIYKDLEILYKIAYQIQKEKYTALESMVNGYLTSLEAAANDAEHKTDFEVNNTNLGKTIYWKENNPAYDLDHNIACFDLGTVSAQNMSDLSFFIEGEGFDKSSCVLCLEQTDTTMDPINILPYEVNFDTYYIQDDDHHNDVNTYDYVLDDKEILTGAFILAAEGLNVSKENSYLVFGAPNYLKTRSSVEGLVEKAQLTANETITISFYLIDAGYINFEFSSEPTSKNFSEYQNIINDSKIHYYKFTIEKGTAFDFDTDGDIYATKENCSVTNDNLYIQNITLAKAFKIYEFSPGENIVFDKATVKIYGVDENSFKVSSIAIKQLTKIEAAEKDLII